VREHAPGVPERWRDLVRRVEGGDARPLTGAQVAQDLDQLEWWIENRYSYAARTGTDWRGALDAIRAAAADGIPRGAFALQLMRALASFGDGHTGLREAPEALLPPGFLPFLVEPVGDRLVAFREDRSALVDDARPYVEALDGVPVERWLAAARSVVARASPAFVRRNAARMLRHVGWIRRELGVASRPEVEVALVSETGADRRTVRLAVAERKPVHGAWPRTASRRLPDGTGYLRVADMDEGSVAGVLEALDGLRDAPRLVVDVRGNGGGSRELLRRMLPRFLPAGSTRVANVAAYRLAPGDDRDAPEGHLADRFLWPLASSVWKPHVRRAIEEFAEGFRPAWEPDARRFSAWHYMAI
jgi:carboxyl-terminal processing protease